MITLIDYGMGNLRNVQRAFEHEGAEILRIQTPDALNDASAIILPGVGHFGDGMQQLRERGFEPILKQKVAEGIPLFGICLGMQMLFDSSEEAPLVNGLGILKGRVIRFPSGEQKVPHMGWNTAHVSNTCRGSIIPLVSLPVESSFYFVHSFYVKPDDDSLTALRSNYILDFTSAVATESIFATQFHPEKSQDVGLNLIRAFIEKVK